MKQLIFNPSDLCARCDVPRSSHSPGKDVEHKGPGGWSSGGTRHTPTFAITCLTGESIGASCTAFIQKGEEPADGKYLSANFRLGPQSQAFFDFRWDQIHGANSRLGKPWFASGKEAKHHAAA